jgi:multidrug efflux pump subunit AcrA (membrane-fusion protein)
MPALNRRTIALGGLVLLLAAGGAWWLTQRQASGPAVLRASGMIEATELRLASEYGGRLATRPVREGQSVRAGSVVATFDTDLLEHQIQLADPASRTHLERQRDRQTLMAPRDSWVLRTVFEPGEQVPPGAPVAILGDLRTLTLKVYLAEDRFGQVSVGQRADVAVDSFPGELFPATIESIASQAEFTPRNVQTQDDRVKSVYAIKLRLANPDLKLKPGMFADAAFASGR